MEIYFQTNYILRIPRAIVKIILVVLNNICALGIKQLWNSIVKSLTVRTNGNRVLEKHKVIPKMSAIFAKESLF